MVIKMKSINPATGKLIKEYAEHTPAQCDAVIDQVYHDWKSWKQETFAHRAKLMMKAADILEKHRQEYGLLITREMGKVIGEAVAEVEKSALVCRYYAENAEKFLSDEEIGSDAHQSLVAFEPLGPVLTVMPWNFPFWQVFRFAAPALMAGNAGVLKHASNVPGCALAIENIFAEAGFPGHIFRSLMIGSKMVEHVIKNKHIMAATLTGSEYAGSKVAEICGRHLKKTVLELGGSDPFVVLADADLDKCTKTAVTARMVNNGQSCIAAKRFIVVKEVYDEFLKKVIAAINSLKTGNPENPETDFGPLARPDLLEELDVQIKKSVSMGAKIETGGEVIAGDGFYYKPAVISGVKPDMPVFHEETFGPALAVIKAQNEEEAIRLANQSVYGLGGSLWTQDIDKGLRLARQIESGAVFVNGMTKSDPRLPFGGIKRSGYGRELAHYGIREFVNIKTIWIGK
jgi:succinate-semialdehyde dehydrogenase / glutarate-semialdehyde dehydrogenase